MRTHPIRLMDEFPDFNVPGFRQELYDRRFWESNVLIHASAKEVFYPEHWGPVSVKCAFNGAEYYQAGRCRYRVDDDCFLLFNEGQTYSSYIHAEKTVESFTINFAPSFVKEVSTGRSSVAFTEDLAEPANLNFCERLYSYNGTVAANLQRLRILSRNFCENQERIEELFFLLLDELFQLHEKECGQVKKVKAIKPSTRRELYQRLMRAKDHIASNYAEDVSLDTLAAATCLNASYLLRQFKLYFNITPRQYAISIRMSVAERLLRNTDWPVTEICYKTGYSDLTSFIKLFKQFYHSTPESYRSKHASKKSISTYERPGDASKLKAN